MSAPVWEDGGWAPRPCLTGDVTADVCVVGLGGSGLTAVAELLDRGATVVGVEAGYVGGGAAGRNGGFLLAGLAHGHHRMVPVLGRERAALLYRRTLEEMDRIEAATPEAVQRKGSLRIERTADGLEDCAAQAAALRADGFAVEEYDGPEGQGLLLPYDGVLQPLARCRQLARSLAASLYELSAVLDITPRLVTTDKGRVRCGAVVVAVDGGLGQLLPELASRVRTVRLQMLATAPTHEIAVPRPVYLRDGYEYWQQLPDGRIALGGFRDRGGREEQTSSTDTSAVVQGALEQFLREDLGVQAPITHRWAASVGYTQDALPYLGQVRQGVWAAGGYCGTGNVVGALCGRQLAANALGESADYFG
ncbi:MAG: dependent oxidoreductase [Frankiales bacterium]|nr:dependent oxidoreductase [Frankiales bacterium]